MGSSDQKRAFLAVILSGFVLFTWQAFFAPKIDTQNNIASTNTARPLKKISASTPSSSLSVESETKTKKGAASPQNIKSLGLQVSGNSIEIGSDLSVISAVNSNEAFKFKDIVGEEVPFKIQAIKDRKALPLNINFATDFTGKSITGIDESLGIRLQGSLDEKGRFSFVLTSTENYQYRMIYNTTPEDLGNRRLRQYIIQMNDTERFEVGNEEVIEGSVKFTGIDHNYHIFAHVFDQKTLMKVQSLSDGRLIADTLRPTNTFSSEVVFTKKNYDDLVTLGNNLQATVDFGFFGVLAVPILRGLQFFYKYFPNYGLSIILLTILIRMLTFPLQYKSFKSMKKMQVVQPELQKLREKFKDDPQRMQKETMELFKKAGANPLGGCFPMLLQMPVFFAFYQVLYNAVELVGAPFIFWIHDLSEKDPYYVLPVLMGLSMFGQSKLNPSTSADPTQQKVMLFMPLIFTFIMKDFPAGLNLYIFISTLFAIVQQLFVYKTAEA